jgi:hypothetical protein
MLCFFSIRDSLYNQVIVSLPVSYLCVCVFVSVCVCVCVCDCVEGVRDANTVSRSCMQE